MKLLLRRRDTEALLDGHPLHDDAGLADVEAFLGDMRVEFGALPAPAPRPTLAATLDGRRPMRPASGPVPKPTFPPAGPRVHHRLRPLGALVATGAVLFGGLATAGALPAPVQRTTAELSSHLGIHLPDASTPRSTPGRVENPGTGGSNAPGSPANPRPAPGSTTVPAPVATTLPLVPTTLPAVPAPSLPTTPTTPTLPLPGSTPGLGAPVPSIPGLIWPITELGGQRTKLVP